MTTDNRNLQAEAKEYAYQQLEAGAAYEYLNEVIMAAYLVGYRAGAERAWLYTGSSKLLFLDWWDTVTSDEDDTK